MSFGWFKPNVQKSQAPETGGLGELGSWHVLVALTCRPGIYVCFAQFQKAGYHHSLAFIAIQEDTVPCMNENFSIL